LRSPSGELKDRSVREAGADMCAAYLRTAAAREPAARDVVAVREKSATSSDVLNAGALDSDCQTVTYSPVVRPLSTLSDRPVTDRESASYTPRCGPCYRDANQR